MYRRTGLIETKLRNENVCCVKAINNNIQICNDYLLHFHSTKNEISRFRIFFERRKSLNAMQTSLGFKRRKFKSAKLCVSHMFTDNFKIYFVLECVYELHIAGMKTRFVLNY